jgi:hypothetical protein
MKKSLATLISIGLIFGAFAAQPAEAKKKRKPKRVERVVEFNYTCPCPGVLQLGSLTADGTNIGGGSVAPGAEVYLTAVSEDSSGMPVSVSFQQIGDGGTNEPKGDMCGETTEPIALTPGADVNIFVNSADPLCGVAAGGTLTITLSNLP